MNLSFGFRASWKKAAETECFTHSERGTRKSGFAKTGDFMGFVQQQQQQHLSNQLKIEFWVIGWFWGTPDEDFDKGFPETARRLDGEEEEEGRSLEQTPTWAVAVVCFALVAISIVIEFIIHLIGKIASTWHPCSKQKEAEMNKANSDDLEGHRRRLLTAEDGGVRRVLAAVGTDKCADKIQRDFDLPETHRLEEDI
ncbi:hypothetical protein HAX54_035046 [Datura stramonium]|uniref:Uncharacterized protein n=1 Tax=Datura stramonium TaxID=4076 RepID=A0ABS8SF46_DATST|nr:hypothetical protein [Datura stramonium]